MLEFTSYNKLIYKLLRSLTEFYELVTAIWFVETPGCHLTHITSTSDAENMKLPKQEYAASQTAQRGVCWENLRITRTAGANQSGRSWHLVSFITWLEVKTNIFSGGTLTSQESIFWNCEWSLWYPYLISRTGGGGGGGVLMVLYSCWCQISCSFSQQPHHICLNCEANTEGSTEFWCFSGLLWSPHFSLHFWPIKEGSMSQSQGFRTKYRETSEVFLIWSTVIFSRVISV